MSSFPAWEPSHGWKFPCYCTTSKSSIIVSLSRYNRVSRICEQVVLFFIVCLPIFFAESLQEPVKDNRLGAKGALDCKCTRKRFPIPVTPLPCILRAKDWIRHFTLCGLPVQWHEKTAIKRSTRWTCKMKKIFFNFVRINDLREMKNLLYFLSVVFHVKKIKTWRNFFETRQDKHLAWFRESTFSSGCS